MQDSILGSRVADSIRKLLLRAKQVGRNWKVKRYLDRDHIVCENGDCPMGAIIRAEDLVGMMDPGHIAINKQTGGYTPPASDCAKVLRVEPMVACLIASAADEKLLDPWIDGLSAAEFDEDGELRTSSVLTAERIKLVREMMLEILAVDPVPVH